MKRDYLAVQFTICAFLALFILTTCDSVDREMLVSTGSVTNITQTSAGVSGTIIDVGQESIQHGHCYGENPGVNVAGPRTTLGPPIGKGDFNSSLTGLKPGTTYYVKAYISDGISTAYGNEISFTTLPVSLAQLTTADATSVTATTAVSGGNITGDGGSVITARGVCWGTTVNPTISDNTTTDGTGTGSFVSNLTGLTPNTTYYVRAYATNSAGTAYGSEVSFATEQVVTVPAVTTTTISSITTTTASGGGNVTSDGNATVTARGICWSTSPSPTITDNTTTDGSGTGSFISSLTGLTPNTTYYVRAYAINSAGTAYGSQRSFTTSPLTVTNPATGKTWMDRNLGANHAATGSADAEAYGDLYQWGRAADGHQKRNSPTTSILSSSDTPEHGNFILAPNSPYDWRSPQNANLWQGVSGVNNPCPDGFRLPTEAEWNAERLSWSSNNAAGAFASPLKLPVAGHRDHSDGSLEGVGTGGDYWSGTVDGTDSRFLYLISSTASTASLFRAYGLSVRCIKN